MENQGQSADWFYRDSMTKWLQPRYDLGKRFVQMTLLLDQGEAAQGPRWQASALILQSPTTSSPGFLEALVQTLQERDV